MSFDHKIWDKVSAEAKDFVRSSLQLNPRDRPTALELLEHTWIKRFYEDKVVTESVRLDVAQNLEDFKATTTFQSGVLSFIIGLKSTSQELEELNKMFILLDTSKDGILSIEEIKQGLDSVLG